MSDAVKNEANLESNPPAASESGPSPYIVIGAVVLGIIALAAYQFFSCSSCY